MYDAIIVGARCAGSTLATQLARKGHRVLLLDKVKFPKDTLSTHFVWPRGASYLNRLGVLDRVLEKAPSGTQIHLAIEDFQMEGSVPRALLVDRFQEVHGDSRGVVQEYFSARRYYLDQILLDLAIESGAEFREGVVVTDVLFEGDTATGIRGRLPNGETFAEKAKVIVGADGRGSAIADRVGAKRKEIRSSCTFAHFTYLSGFDLGGVTIQKRGRLGLGIVKTNDNANMTLVFGPKDWYAAYKRDEQKNFYDTLSFINPDLGEKIRSSSRQEERFYGTNEQTAFIRPSSGKGWMLIGDAASFKDQCTASGMTHAFRDAELAASNLHLGFSGEKSIEDSLSDYRHQRLMDSWRYYEFVCQQAEMNPARSDELQLLRAMQESKVHQERFIATYADTYSVRRFFSKGHTKEILALTQDQAPDFGNYEKRLYDYYRNPYREGESGASEAKALSRTCADFAAPVGNDLLSRTEAYYDWQSNREKEETWQYSRTLKTFPGPVTHLEDDLKRTINGINFASQDYLALGGHPAIYEAAKAALAKFGPHSAGSPMIIGNTELTTELEAKLSEILRMEHVMIFPTGWAAGFGTITGLVKPNDHIVMDKLSHACLQQGAYSACRNIHRHPHLDVDGARAQLEKIREKDRQNGILVISEGIFSMDSDTPDLAKLQEVCHEYGATLMVDVAHDLGAMGPGGSGQLGLQGLLGKVDLVMGSFSKTFASNGGFLATNKPSVRQYVKMFGNSHLFSNALSPSQTAVALESARIVSSPEGDQLREQLFTVVRTMRGEFEKRGIQCMGTESAIIPVPIGDERVARIAHRLCRQRNIATMILEFPVVATGASRFRLQVMSSHNVEQARIAAAEISDIIREAREYVEKHVSGDSGREVIEEAAGLVS